ncbi:hypothetical protein ScPMuIL_004677 [Solemya velum]
MSTSQHCLSPNSALPPRKKQRSFKSFTAVDTRAVVAVSTINDEEPDGVEEPQETQETDAQETRGTDEDPLLEHPRRRGFTSGSFANGPRIMWWNSQRSAFRKITRSVSGQGRKRLTAREERLKERLAFLSADVYSVPKRAGVDLMRQLREKHPDRFNADLVCSRVPHPQVDVQM